MKLRKGLFADEEEDESLGLGLDLDRKEVDSETNSIQQRRSLPQPPTKPPSSSKPAPVAESKAPSAHAGDGPSPLKADEEGLTAMVKQLSTRLAKLEGGSAGGRAREVRGDTKSDATVLQKQWDELVMKEEQLKAYEQRLRLTQDLLSKREKQLDKRMLHTKPPGASSTLLSSLLASPSVAPVHSPLTSSERDLPAANAHLPPHESEREQHGRKKVEHVREEILSEVLTWGAKEASTLGFASSIAYQPLARPVSGLSGRRIVQVAVNGYVAGAVSEQGELFTWGRASMRIPSSTSSTTRATNSLPAGAFTSTHPPTPLSGGGEGVLVHLLGHGPAAADEMQWQPKRVECLEQVKAVAFGQYHAAAVAGGGYVYGWGWNRYGQCGSGRDTEREVEPTAVYLLRGGDGDQLLEDVVHVSCGDAHTSALASVGIVWMYGLNLHGQLGLGDRALPLSPMAVPNLPPIRRVSCGPTTSVAVSDRGQLYLWGGFDPSPVVLSPRRVDFPSETFIRMALSTDQVVLAVTDLGELFLITFDSSSSSSSTNHSSHPTNHHPSSSTTSSTSIVSPSSSSTQVPTPTHSHSASTTNTSTSWFSRFGSSSQLHSSPSPGVATPPPLLIKALSHSHSVVQAAAHGSRVLLVSDEGQLSTHRLDVRAARLQPDGSGQPATAIATAACGPDVAVLVREDGAQVAHSRRVSRLARAQFRAVHTLLAVYAKPLRGGGLGAAHASDIQILLGNVDELFQQQRLLVDHLDRGLLADGVADWISAAIRCARTHPSALAALARLQASGKTKVGALLRDGEAEAERRRRVEDGPGPPRSLAHLLAELPAQLPRFADAVADWASVSPEHDGLAKWARQLRRAARQIDDERQDGEFRALVAAREGLQQLLRPTRRFVMRADIAVLGANLFTAPALVEDAASHKGGEDLWKESFAEKAWRMARYDGARELPPSRQTVAISGAELRVMRTLHELLLFNDVVCLCSPKKLEVVIPLEVVWLHFGSGASSSVVDLQAVERAFTIQCKDELEAEKLWTQLLARQRKVLGANYVDPLRRQVARYRFADGSVYVGQWWAGKFDGEGVYERPNGDRYSGEWVAGLRHGHGTSLLHDGRSRYEGAYRADRRHGHGRLSTPSSSSQSSVQSTTHSILDEASVRSYVGGWRSDKPHGPGVLTYRSGDVLHGHWRRGELKAPVSVLGAKDASLYVGEYLLEAQTPHGFGVKTVPAGPRYYGEWDGGGRSGIGLFRAPDQSVYLGEFLEDRVHGRGILAIPGRCLLEGRMEGAPGSKPLALLDQVDVSNAVWSRGSPADLRALHAQLWSSTFLGAASSSSSSSSASSTAALAAAASSTSSSYSSLVWSILTTSLCASNPPRQAPNASREAAALMEYTTASLRRVEDKSSPGGPLGDALRNVLTSPAHPLSTCVARFCDYFEYMNQPAESAFPHLALALDDLHAFRDTVAAQLAKLLPVVDEFAEAAQTLRDATETVLFQRLFFPVFALFRIKWTDEDRKLAKRCARLRSYSVPKLAAFLGVGEDWLDLAKLGYFARMQKNAAPPDHLPLPFADAVASFSKLAQLQAPHLKVRILEAVSRDIDLAVAANASGKPLGADDLLPILMFVIVHADVPYLASELHFMAEFLDPALKFELLGCLLTNFEVAAEFLRTLTLLD